jgi:uncharacterized protein YgbK (DUF1537 family)
MQAQLGVDEAGATGGTRPGPRIALGPGGAAGVGRLVVAGGETSGACVQALGITRCASAPDRPGRALVPRRHAGASRGLHLALKSGNFGGVDFFRQAFTLLQ